MQWYWWVLIGIGVVVIGYIKIIAFKVIQAKAAEKKKTGDLGGDAEE